MYGGPSGLRVQGAQYWTQDTPGMMGQGATGGAEFGRAMAGQDFNRDGYDDLAIGPRHESIVDGGTTIDQAGAINVIYGGPTGLAVDAGPGNQYWTENSPGLPTGGAQANDWFGRPIKAGDFNGDGYGDMAVGIFHKRVGSKNNAGALLTIYGGPNGLAADAGPGSQLFTQDTPGIAGGPAVAGTYFSRFDAAGDFNGDGFADIEIGSPSDTEGTVKAAGTATILYGGPSGLTVAGPPASQLFDEDTAGMVGGPAFTKDWFGHGDSLVGDLNGDGYMDAAVGALLREVGTLTDAGAMDVIFGGPSGLAADAGPGNQYWDANSAGMPGQGAQASAGWGGNLAQAADGGSG